MNFSHLENWDYPAEVRSALAKSEEHEANVVLATHDTPETQPQFRRMQDILHSYQSASGVLFRVFNGVIILVPPPQYRLLDSMESSQTLVGGHGMTGRDVEDMDQEAKGVAELLNFEKGKIVFLGNGFSEAPLEIAKRYELGSLAHPPTIVELFDYDKLRDDLDFLNYSVPKETGFIHPQLFGYHKAINSITRAQANGAIKIVNYNIGSGNPPEQIQNASLAINIYGPTSKTFPEQLSLLRPGGRLVVAQGVSSYDSPPNVTSFALGTPGSMVFTKAK